MVDLAENYDMEKGEVIYTSPVDGHYNYILIVNIISFLSYVFLGSQLCLWTGVNVSQEGFVALLMCVALNGYH